MKKVLLIAAVAFSALTASAQTEQGKILVGGTVDYTTEKSDAEGAKSSDNLTILPMAGYFIQENIALGTGIGFQTSKAPSGAKENSFVISPFGRYYKGISEQFKFFGQLAVPMVFGTEKNSDGDKVGTSTGIGVSLSPGFAFFPAKKFGIELAFSGISYFNETQKNEDGDKIKGAGGSSFNIGADFFSPQIGLLFYF